MDRIRSEFDRLARMPHLGRRREDLGHPALRSWVVFDYLIFYVVLDRHVLIARVVHGHQDLRQLAYEDNDRPDRVCEPRLRWVLANAG